MLSWIGRDPPLFYSSQNFSIMPNPEKRTLKPCLSDPEKKSPLCKKSQLPNGEFKPRKLTLSYDHNLKYDKESRERYYTPKVLLGEQWMYDAGFRCGQKVEVIVRERELTIRIVEEGKPAFVFFY